MSAQLALLPGYASTPDFDGETYERKLDKPRLSFQLDQIRFAMSFGKWWTLAELARVADCSEASASARLRDLRKAKFGGHTVDRQRLAGGLHRYRLIPVERP
jgi:hypothetical protein